jgi:hypothetical protein
MLLERAETVELMPEVRDDAVLAFHTGSRKSSVRLESCGCLTA